MAKKYNTMTNVTRESDEFQQKASMAFGCCLMTPATEAEIDRRLGVPETVIESFLHQIMNPGEVETPLDDQEGPTAEDLLAIENEGI